MELMTLDSSFQPNNLVENYESLIWTERYSSYGDFEVTSGDVRTMLNLLPRESYVGLRESTVPMIVENHKITKGPRQAPMISVTGRSFETVLERRASVRTPLTTGTAGALFPWNIVAVSESDAAFRAMRTVLGDSAQSEGGLVVLPLLAPAVSVNDEIPEITLTIPFDYDTAAWSSTIVYNQGDIVGSGTVIYQATSLTSPINLNKPPATEPTYWTSVSTGHSGTWGTGKVIEIPRKDLYSTVIELLTTNRHGMKAVRPTASGTKVGVEIYNGANLTGEGPGSDPNFVVVFDARFDQFDNATYLLSQQGSTNFAYVYTTSGSEGVKKNEPAPEPFGLARRVLLVDAMGDDTLATTEGRKSRGLVELYQFNATALVDGEVSEQVAAGFNKTYFLGDILKLVAEYGLTRNVRVAEFIRTSDATGEKAYPAFEAVD